MDLVCIRLLLHISCPVVSMMFGLVYYPPGRKSRIKWATHEVLNDLKQFISQNGNVLLQKNGIHDTQGVDEFIKDKIVEWDFMMTLTEMNKEHQRFCGDFEILLMSIIHKMPIIIFQNDSKCLLMVTTLIVCIPLMN